MMTMKIMILISMIAYNSKKKKRKNTKVPKSRWIRRVVLVCPSVCPLVCLSILPSLQCHSWVTKSVDWILDDGHFTEVSAIACRFWPFHARVGNFIRVLGISRSFWPFHSVNHITMQKMWQQACRIAHNAFALWSKTEKSTAKMVI